MWLLLSNDGRENHIKTYKLAKSNLENGISKTIVDHVKVVNSAPATTYFPIEEGVSHQVNCVGCVLHNGGRTIVEFDSQDLVEILTIYFGQNIKDNI